VVFSDYKRNITNCSPFFIGTVALREISMYKKFTQLLMARKPFEYIVRQIANKITRPGAGNYFRWQPASLDSFCKAAKAFLTPKFESKYKSTPVGLLF
jgi:histone H3/H4